MQRVFATVVNFVTSRQEVERNYAEYGVVFLIGFGVGHTISTLLRHKTQDTEDKTEPKPEPSATTGQQTDGYVNVAVTVAAIGAAAIAYFGLKHIAEEPTTTPDDSDSDYEDEENITEEDDVPK